MKKTKKESWIKNFFEWNYSPIIVGILVVISIIIWGLIQNSTSYFCSQHPEKCVCERPHGEQWCDWQNGTIIAQTTYHPKNECEKGNPDYYQSNNITEVDTSITRHKECKLQIGWFCPAIGIVNLPCNNITHECLLNPELRLNYVGCRYGEVCVSNQSICKKK